MRYSIEPKIRKYVKGYGFLAFARNLWSKYGKQLLDTASKNIIHEAAEATGEFLGNKIAGTVAISHTTMKLWKENLLKKWLFHQKREEILKELRQVL